MVSSAFPSHVEFYDSARSFARTALEAQNAGDVRRTFMDAGTALEHLIKGCLAKRSPVLLLELDERNWGALLLVLGEADVVAKAPRTISLSIAIDRFRALVNSGVDRDDLADLVLLRNGVVHAAAAEPVEERVFSAFLRQVDACVEDYGTTRADFWGEHLGAVEALLEERSTRIERVVGHKLAMARQQFKTRFGDFDSELVKALVGSVHSGDTDEAAAPCPACAGMGVALGEHKVESDYYLDHHGEIEGGSWVQFDAESFGCIACGLRLESQEEMEQAGMETSWPDEDVDPSDLLSWEDDYQ
jgi:hypothetical protein